MSDELYYLIFIFFFPAADMYRVKKKDRMKRWRQQRLQNRAIQIGISWFQISNQMKTYIYIGHLLHRRDSVEAAVSSRMDDAIDINSIKINDKIDDSMETSPIVGESTLLTDAMYDLYFIVFPF